MIQIEGLSKSFGGIRAVDDLTLSIPEGQCIGLLGPNGAGKTTTINMIVGTVAPDTGSILIGEFSAQNVRARRQVGIAPQAIALYEELTARENLNFFGGLFGLPRTLKRDRIEWALELSQLASRAHDRVGGFSGGMKRRLNLAAALIHDPQVILLDEPTVGVDPQSRNHIFECIEHLKREKRTIIYTSHYMEEVERLCDEIAIIDQGRLLANDTLDALLQQHAGQSEVVAQLSGDLPESANLEGTVVDGEWRFTSDAPFQVIATATQAGVPLASLQVSRPNLEQVFLHLTGRRLRD